MAALKGLTQAAGALLALAAPAQACPLALVLAMDVSASVDAQEFQLQTQGTAAALASAPVQAAILADPPVALAVTLWAGQGEQAAVLDWRTLATPTDILAAADAIAAIPRPDWGGRTATAPALAHVARLLVSAPPCARAVIDLTTDDVANEGGEPAVQALGDIAVNALAVGGDLPLDHGSRAAEGGALTRWLASHVIRGPGAFVEGADDWRDFAAAMERKLLREIAGSTFAGLRQP